MCNGSSLIMSHISCTLKLIITFTTQVVRLTEHLYSMLLHIFIINYWYYSRPMLLLYSTYSMPISSCLVKLIKLNTIPE